MKFIKSLILIIIIVELMAFSNHIETVVVYNIQDNDKTLSVSAKMKKSYASILVMTKGEMVSSKNRGIQLNKIIQENTTFNINGLDYNLKFDTVVVDKQNLELKYYLDNIPSNIQSLTMHNSVIVGPDDLAIVNAYFEIKNKTRKVLRFSKKNSSRTITY